MKKSIATIALAAVIGSSAYATEGLSITGSFDFESEYVFRGKRFTQAAFQPSVEFGYTVGPGVLYTGIWTNFPVSNNNNTQDNEIDIYGGYALPVSDMLTLDAGFTYYWYPQANSTVNPVTMNLNRAREVYFGVQADVLLSPAVYAYYDFDREQLVLEGSIGYSLPLSEYLNVPLSLDTGAYIGYLHADAYNGNQRQAGVTKWRNSYAYAGASVDLVYAFSENLAFSIGGRVAGNNDGTAGGPANSSPQLGNEMKLWWGSSLVFSY